MARNDLITKDFALYVVHYFASMQTWSKKEILGEIDRTIKEAKKVDAVPVVRGRWKRTTKYDPDSSVQCSECQMAFDYIDGICYLVADARLPHYCPNCGARMDGEASP